MVVYSKAQERVARALLSGPKTLMELKEQSSLQANDLNEAVKKLIQLRVIESKTGKYQLIEQITKALEGDDVIEAIFIIEGTSSDKEALMSRMQLMHDKLKLNLKPRKIELVPVIEKNGQFSNFIEFTTQFKGLQRLISAVVDYGPSSVEILKPKSIKLDLYSLQMLVSDFTSAIHYYATVILNATMNIQKLRNENRELQKKLAEILQTSEKK